MRTLTPAVITMKTKRMEHNTTHIKNQQFFTYLNPKTKFIHTAQLKCPKLKYQHNPQFKTLDGFYILQSSNTKDYQSI